MIKKRCFLIFIVSIFLFFEGCVIDKFDSRLKLINNSDSNLFTFSEFSNINDTLIECDNCFSQENNWIELYGHDTLSIGLHGKLYDEYLIKNPNQIFRVFVFESDTIKKYGWEKAQKDNLILKRYDINLEYIKKNKWIIKYPDSISVLK